MPDINLVPVQERVTERFESLKKRLSVGSAILLVLTAVFTLGVLVFFTTQVSGRSQLLAQVEDNAQVINSYKSTEELLVVAKDKSSLAEKVLAQRTDYYQTFNGFAKLVPQGVYFTDIKFAAGKIVMNGKAKSSAEIAGLVSSLLTPEGSKIVSNVTIDTLTADETGVYTFSIAAQATGKD
ncbi:MAG TPA: PilN domain-containing protein [Patescibacteria group bacterium]|nr:PilN domain-containing protein [Patescibacteria group bacterium]